ncbi:SagB/ThcOx family dehydrogenase [Angustibacter sp. McL0619]|uniref:SagB/ThcOx family dehydrogenase n=1 Tax=Angustibacter sp. McL0619 TaxID=3415676 RepID=UPI003CE82B9C
MTAEPVTTDRTEGAAEPGPEPEPLANGPLFASYPVRAHHRFDPVDPEGEPDVGADFHEATKLHPALSAYVTGPAEQLWTPGYESVPNEGLATRRWYTRAHPLPVPEPVDRTLSEVVAQRVSTSPPGAEGLTAAELSSVLFLAYGATPVPGDPRVHRRPVPSGGALYPLDLYVAVGPEGLGDSEIGSGLFHYDPFRHCLEELRDGRGWDQVVTASIAQSTVRGSSVVLCMVACFARQTGKYGERGYRFTYLEAGHVGQNVGLACTGLGLGCLPFASIYDAAVEQALGVDGLHESLVHTVLLGRR